MSRVLPLQKGVIYGPVNSRRLGRSLGINLSPTTYKICSFNCVYCHYGWTEYLKSDLSDHAADLPTVETVERELEKALQALEPPPQYITFSGNGEPTLHPAFDEIVDAVLGVKRRSGVDAKVAVLSNSTAVLRDRVRKALQRLDVRIMKLDAGTDEGLKLVNRPAPEVCLDEIVEGLRQLEDVTLQSVFVNGEVSNTAEADIEAWLERVGILGPKFVQVYSLENAPAMSTLIGVPAETLRDIAQRAGDLTGGKACAY
jgi:wyosine [tRNA(Phe)-imidazoG37] synthetase (radical SAM superfamily)